MPRDALRKPTTDPTVLFELFRGSYGSELLTAAIAHFQVFDLLANGSQSIDDLQTALRLERRPATVLLTALRAMGLINTEPDGRLALSPLALEHLVPNGQFYVGDYVGLAADSPGVVEMVERLRTNRPAGAGNEQGGAAFIFREGLDSAMEREASARHLTLALAGRAKNVAPVLAERLPMDGVKTLLDVGGGTGIYGIALLQRHPELRVIVLDRPEVLKITRELADAYGVAERCECIAGDMFTDQLPTTAQAILLSNILHDWDVPECRQLIGRCADALPSGGRLLIHDVFLDDDLAGPLPLALYSAALFTLTEGRAYSAAEYRKWLVESGLEPEAILPTLVHCGVLPAGKT
jgi:predicted O-methyltransferase YrrM